MSRGRFAALEDDDADAAEAADEQQQEAAVGRRGSAGRFEALADAELLSVLQWLDPTSLCLVSASCRRMRVQTNDPFVWRRFEDGRSVEPELDARFRPSRAPPLPSKQSRVVVVPRVEPQNPTWQASPMLRRWLPVVFDLADVADKRDVGVVVEQSKRFGHIVRLDKFENLVLRFDDPHRLLLMILRAPAMQRLRQVTLHSAGLDDPLFSGACALPLRHLSIGVLSLRLRAREAPIVSAKALAGCKELRRVDVLECFRPAEAFLPLASIPRLETLTLAMQSEVAPDSIGRRLDELPSMLGLHHLTRLDLLGPYWIDAAGDEEKFASILRQLPLLQQLCTPWLEFGEPLRALLAVGPDKLPCLSHLRWSDVRHGGPSTYESQIDRPLFSRVMRLYPNLRVCQDATDHSGLKLAGCEIDCCRSKEEACKLRFKEEAAALAS